MLLGTSEMLELWKENVLKDANMILSYSKGSEWCESRENSLSKNQQFSTEMKRFEAYKFLFLGIFATFCYLIYHYLLYPNHFAYETIP